MGGGGISYLLLESKLLSELKYVFKYSCKVRVFKGLFFFFSDYLGMIPLYQSDWHIPNFQPSLLWLEKFQAGGSCSLRAQTQMAIKGGASLVCELNCL